MQVLNGYSEEIIEKDICQHINLPSICLKFNDDPERLCRIANKALYMQQYEIILDESKDFAIIKDIVLQTEISKVKKNDVLLIYCNNKFDIITEKQFENFYIYCY